MNVESESTQDLVRLAYKGGSLVLNTSRWGKHKGLSIAAYLQARLKAASENKASGVIPLDKLNQNGEPISVAFISKKDLEVFKKLAKEYSLLYSVVMSSKGGDNDTVDIFFRTVDAPKVRRILERAKIATVEPDLSNVEIGEEMSDGNNVVHAKVNLGEATEQKTKGEEKQDPLEKSPSEKHLGQKEKISVRTEILNLQEKTKTAGESENLILKEQLNVEFGKDKNYGQK